MSDLIITICKHGVDLTVRHCNMCKTADALEAKDAEIERLREALEGSQVLYRGGLKTIAKLQAVVDAAKDDMECAKANCGQYPEAKGFSGKDCSAFTERGLRCSDCPVDVWLASTGEALAALEGE